MSWAASFTFLAVWLVVRPSGALRLSRLAAAPGVAKPTRLRERWPVLAAVLPAVAGVAVSGWSVGLAAGSVGWCVAWVVRRNLRRRAADRARAEVVTSCHVLAGLLRVGLVPAAALKSAAADASLLAEAAATAALGGEASAALRRRADAPGCAGLTAVAHAWELAEFTGASMTTSLDAVASRLAADAEVRHTVASELSAPRATGRMLAVLPLAGLAVGYALGGDPASFLTSSLTGQLCIVGGAALTCAGVVWTEKLAEQHEGLS